MSWVTRGARRGWALSVLLLAAAPVRAQGAEAPTVDQPEQAQPAPPGSPDAMRSPAESAPPAAAAAPPSWAPPVVDPPVSAPPAGLVPPAAVEPGRSPAPAGPGTADERHTGWFVHADFGAGYLRTTGSRGGSNFTTQGAALCVSLALGWAPNEEWAIGLEGLGWKSLTASGLGPNTSVELQALGLNVTRYFVPADIFATVVVAGTRLAITDEGDYAEHGSSDIGFGFKALLGKEWRVGPGLGLGLAGELVVSVNREGGQTLRTLGAGLVLSFTLR